MHQDDHALSFCYQLQPQNQKNIQQRDDTGQQEIVFAFISFVLSWKTPMFQIQPKWRKQVKTDGTLRPNLAIGDNTMSSRKESRCLQWMHVFYRLIHSMCHHQFLVDHL